jgi:hypothetical protein
MTSTLTRPPDVTTPTATRTLASRRDDAIGALCGLALICGGLTDAWANVNLLSTIDGFFTPWHALLYSGFAATAAWTWWLAFRHRREDPGWFRNRWPIGYGIGAIGSLVFLVGGAGDMFGHEILGVEASLEAALSPSHLVISFGGVLLLTSQMRSWWASGEGGPRTVTGLVSASLGTIIGVVIVVPMTGINTITPMDQVSAAIIGMIIGAAVVDVVLYRIDSVRGVAAPWRMPIAGTVFSTGIWSGHLMGLRIGAGIQWPRELWAGTQVQV